MKSVEDLDVFKLAHQLVLVLKDENGKMNEKLSSWGKGPPPGRVRGDLNARTKAFAIRVVQLYSELPKRREAQVIGDHVLRSGTSVGAHFREVQRAKSDAD